MTVAATAAAVAAAAEEEAVTAAAEASGGSPALTARAADAQMDLFVPGRVCLLGEHSDWAGGFRRDAPSIPQGKCLVVRPYSLTVCS
jgi:hypothetical protein